MAKKLVYELKVFVDEEKKMDDADQYLLDYREYDFISHLPQSEIEYSAYKTIPAGIFTVYSALVKEKNRVKKLLDDISREYGTQ